MVVHELTSSPHANEAIITLCSKFACDGASTSYSDSAAKAEHTQDTAGLSYNNEVEHEVDNKADEAPILSNNLGVIGLPDGTSLLPEYNDRGDVCAQLKHRVYGHDPCGL